MEEFLLEDLADAGQLLDFKRFRQGLLNRRIEKARLRIAAKGGFMPSALYWHDSLRKDLGLGVTVTLAGDVGLPGLVVWVGAASRRIEPDARVMTGGYASLGTGECERALEALVGAMCCTDAENRDRFRERTAEEWLTKNLILDSDRLRRVFWIPPETPNLRR